MVRNHKSSFLDQIRSFTVNIKLNVANIAQNVDEIEHDLDEIEHNVDEITHDVGKIRLNVGRIKLYVGNILCDVDDYKHNVGSITPYAVSIECIVGNISYDICKLKCHQKLLNLIYLKIAGYWCDALQLKSNKKEILILLTVALAFATSLFLLWAYGSLLDFFPWGGRNAYVIWEPLMLYFIVPSFIIIGCLIIFLNASRNVKAFGVHCFLIGLGYILPSLFSFDLESDLVGRWSGVIVSIIAIGLITLDSIKVINQSKNE